MEPGVTTKEEVLNILDNFGVDYEVTPNLGPDAGYYTFYLETSLNPDLDKYNWYTSIFVLDGRAYTILIPADICLSTVIESYGIPPKIDEGYDEIREEWFVYDDIGLAVGANKSDRTRLIAVALFSEEHLQDISYRLTDLHWEEVQDQYSGECEDSFSH
jgi:hypothetical protein